MGILTKLGLRCVKCDAMISATSSSSLCKHCYTKQVANSHPWHAPLQTGSGVPYPSNPLFVPQKRVCKECHHPFTIVRSKDVCHPCYTRDKEKEQLKLFEVSVWEDGNSGRPSSTTVILDVDEDGACDNVLEKMGYTNVSKTEVTELVGPYAPGFIVSFSTLE